MKNRRTIGYLLMIIAILIPLYLFGSMSIDILLQQNRFKTFLETSYMEDIYKNGLMDKALAYNSHLGEKSMPVDPFESEDYKVDYGISDDPDAQFAYMTIPSVEISQPILLGATSEHLYMGLAHVDGTALPIGEKNTRSVIAGHRLTANNLFLLHVDKIKEEDTLNIYIGGKTLKYKMISREIISPEDWEKLLPIKDKEILTILTCDPVPTYENRMLVNFERVVDKDLQIAESSKETNPTIDITKITNKQEASSISNRKYILFAICILLMLILIYLVFKLFKTNKKK